MKNLTIIVSVIIFSCQQTTNSGHETEKIKRVILHYYDALKNRDFDKMSAVTTSDFMLYENGDTLNNDSTVHFFNNYPKFTVKFRFDSLDIKIDNETASAHYTKEAAFNLSDTMHLEVTSFETATFIKENDIWKMEKLQSVKIA